MGSFSITCTASKLTVNAGDEVYLFPLFPDKYSDSAELAITLVSNSGAFCKYGIGPPLLGEYADYGRVDLHQEQNPVIDSVYKKVYGENYQDILEKQMDQPDPKPFCVILKDVWDATVKESDKDHIHNVYIRAQFFIAHGFQLKEFDETKFQVKRNVCYQLEHPDSDIVAFCDGSGYIDSNYYNTRTDSYHKIKDMMDTKTLAAQIATPLIYPSQHKAEAFFFIQSHNLQKKKSSSLIMEDGFRNLLMFTSFKRSYVIDSWNGQNPFYQTDSDLNEWVNNLDLSPAYDLISEFNVVYWFMLMNNRIFEVCYTGPQCPEANYEFLFHNAVQTVTQKRKKEYEEEYED